jgi:hypothetical protein
MDSYQGFLPGNIFIRDKDWACDASGQHCHVDFSKPDTFNIIENKIVIRVPPQLDDCSEASLSKPKWDLLGLNFDLDIYTNETRTGRHPPPPDALSFGNLVAELYFHNLDMHYWCGYDDYSLGPFNPPKYSHVGSYPCYQRGLNAEPDRTPTNFTFDATNFRFEIEQQWGCQDDAGGR